MRQKNKGMIGMSGDNLKWKEMQIERERGSMYQAKEQTLIFIAAWFIII